MNRAKSLTVLNKLMFRFQVDNAHELEEPLEQVFVNMFFTDINTDVAQCRIDGNKYNLLDVDVDKNSVTLRVDGSVNLPNQPFIILCDGQKATWVLEGDISMVKQDDGRSTLSVTDAFVGVD